MNYPPANVWTKLEPEIEQRIEPEPALLRASAGLYLPAAWSEERRTAFVDRWIAS
jgi:hypothetical protein